MFFTFTSDPFLKETIDLTHDAIGTCLFFDIPVTILTKTTWWVNDFLVDINMHNNPNQNRISYGFTLTGHDELEPGASTNQERIDAMRNLHKEGFRTWASIEPIIDIQSSYNMIYETKDFCDLYKIGLESGKKYVKSDLKDFVELIFTAFKNTNTKLYFKDSLLKQSGIERSTLPSNCVNSDYNMFKS